MTNWKSKHWNFSLPQCQSHVGGSSSCWTLFSKERPEWESYYWNAKLGRYPIDPSASCFDHLVQRREPSPVWCPLTDAVCRLVAHQDPRGGRVPWIHKLVSQTSAGKNVKLFQWSLTQPRRWSPDGWIVVSFPMQVWQVENNRLAWIQQWLVPSKNIFGFWLSCKRSYSPTNWCVPVTRHWIRLPDTFEGSSKDKRSNISPPCDSTCVAALAWSYPALVGIFI